MDAVLDLLHERGLHGGYIREIHVDGDEQVFHINDGTVCACIRASRGNLNAQEAAHALQHFLQLRAAAHERCKTLSEAQAIESLRQRLHSKLGILKQLSSVFRFHGRDARAAQLDTQVLQFHDKVASVETLEGAEAVMREVETVQASTGADVKAVRQAMVPKSVKHPDNGGDSADFQRGRQAYAMLSGSTEPPCATTLALQLPPLTASAKQSALRRPSVSSSVAHPGRQFLPPIKSNQPAQSKQRALPQPLACTSSAHFVGGSLPSVATTATNVSPVVAASVTNRVPKRQVLVEGKFKGHTSPLSLASAYSKQATTSKLLPLSTPVVSLKPTALPKLKPLPALPVLLTRQDDKYLLIKTRSCATSGKKRTVPAADDGAGVFDMATHPDEYERRRKRTRHVE